MQNELALPAKQENWEQVHCFLNQYLDSKGCTEKVRTQLLIAAEEIYVNIAQYAYQDRGDMELAGIVSIEVNMQKDSGQAVITFKDNGIRYDPLKKDAPDITLSANQRQIGGLGIYIVRKMMDEVEYKYEDGYNILTIKKG